MFVASGHLGWVDALPDHYAPVLAGLLVVNKHRIGVYFPSSFLVAQMS
jgi:hypothetical protein